MASGSTILPTIAPEVEARADAATWLEIAALQLTASTWGACYELACCYLAAHMATLHPLDADDSAEAADVVGPITAKGARDLSVSYGSPTAGVSGVALADAALMTTKYGLQFLRLRGTRAAAAPRVVRP